MTRDPGLEEQLLDDLGQPEGITSRAMFGGLCYMLNGHMLAAAREGRAMYRVGPDADARALILPGTERMTQTNRSMPGYIWLSDPGLSDDAIRSQLAQMALAHVKTLPPKDR